MDPNTPKKFFLEIYIEEKKLPMIPFIQNVFGGIFFGILQELNDISPDYYDNNCECRINSDKNSEQCVIITFGDNTLIIKKFIQEMIWKTLIGYISSLKKVPENLIDANISFIIKKN